MCLENGRTGSNLTAKPDPDLARRSNKQVSVIHRFYVANGMVKHTSSYTNAEITSYLSSPLSTLPHMLHAPTLSALALHQYFPAKFTLLASKIFPS
jgi:hypothetical protein